MACEEVLSYQPEDLAALAGHDLSMKGKPAIQFGVEFRPADTPPHYEGARSANVDGIEVLQLPG